MGPISRRNLISALRRLGFDGPISGTRHEYMERPGRRVRLPNPHRGDVSTDLVIEILRQAGVSRAECESI